MCLDLTNIMKYNKKQGKKKDAAKILCQKNFLKTEIYGPGIL